MSAQLDMFGALACAGSACPGPSPIEGAAPVNSTTEERQAFAQRVFDSLPHASGCGAPIPVLAIVAPDDQCRYHTSDHYGAWVQTVDVNALHSGREIACYSERASKPDPNSNTGGVYIELIKGRGNVHVSGYAEQPDKARKGLSFVGAYPTLAEARTAAEAWLPIARAHVDGAA